MKFCPQCGTTFEPGARFCLECGFDRATVEPVESLSNSGPEIVVNPNTSVPANPACPQCGSELSPGERFCQECGFDTINKAAATPVVEPVFQPVIVDEVFAPIVPVETPEVPLPNKQFCPQCGASFGAADRFCEECGFDTIAGITETPEEKPAVQPAIAEEIPTPAVLAEEPVVQEANKQFCPQCGASFGAADRFCEECGFDTIAGIPETPEEKPATPPAVIEEIPIPAVMAAEPVAQETDKQFCPQCGASFDAAARFCEECGFDTAAAITEIPEEKSATPPVVAEEIPAPAVIVEEPVLPEMDKQFCPQCGASFGAADRFCEECGFDTAAGPTFHPEEKPAGQPSIVEEIPVPLAVAEEPVSPNKKFCPKCGSANDPSDRFCDECGFDTVDGVVEPEAGIAPQFIPVTPPPVTEPKPATPPIPHRTAASAPPAYTQPANYQPPSIPQKSKKPWLWILVMVLVVGALGAGGWFGYNKFIANKTEVPADTVTNAVVPEAAVFDTSQIATDEIKPEITESEQPLIAKKPLSKVDQELAKQKAKQQAQQQNNTSQPATSSTDQPVKTDMGVKITSSPATSENTIKVIMGEGRKEDPKRKNPKNPAKLVLLKNTMIVRITTDHYNDGMGTPGVGTISIKDRYATVIGTYKVSGKAGANGAPNAKWVVEPRKLLEKGTYYIWDSDFSTWSKTFVGEGFITVEGYEVE